MTSPRTTYSVRAFRTESGDAVAEVGSETIRFDANWASVETSGLPGPAEMLAVSFSACPLKNVERASQLLGFEYSRAEVEVIARRQDTPPKFVEISYDLRIETLESQHRVDLVHRNLRKFGTVYNTLAAVCDVRGTAVAVAPPGTEAIAR